MSRYILKVIEEPVNQHMCPLTGTSLQASLATLMCHLNLVTDSIGSQSHVEQDLGDNCCSKPYPVPDDESPDQTDRQVRPGSGERKVLNAGQDSVKQTVTFTCDSW